MISVYAISEAITAQLRDYPAVGEIGFQEIVQGDFVNEDPARTPWMGIYRDSMNYSPRTLGRGARNWEGELKFKIVIQASSTKDGQDCELLLEGYVQTVMEALLSDTTLGGKVDILNGFNVEYSYRDSDQQSFYFQMAVITMTAEVATT